VGDTLSALIKQRLVYRSDKRRYFNSAEVAAAGILEEDGLVLLGGLLLAPIAAGIAGVAVYFAWTHGLDAVEEHAKPLIKGWLGLS